MLIFITGSTITTTAMPHSRHNDTTRNRWRMGPDGAWFTMATAAAAPAAATVAATAAEGATSTSTTLKTRSSNSSNGNGSSGSNDSSGGSSNGRSSSSGIASWALSSTFFFSSSFTLLITWIIYSHERLLLSPPTTNAMERTGKPEQQMPTNTYIRIIRIRDATDLGLKPWIFSLYCTLFHNLAISISFLYYFISLSAHFNVLVNRLFGKSSGKRRKKW